MVILNSQINNNIGQSGQVPQLIYIDTNNTQAEVTTAGYLNSLMSQGYEISDTQMAMITTKTSPNARASSTSLYSISVTNGVPSLSISGFDPAGDIAITGEFSVVSEELVEITTLDDLELTGSGTVTLSSLEENLVISVQGVNTATASIEAGSSTLTMVTSAGSGTGNITLQAQKASAAVAIRSTNGTLTLLGSSGVTLDVLSDGGAASATPALVPSGANLKFVVWNSSTKALQYYNGV